ncbi:MAG: RDD family protein [Methanothrix sp.]|jgi:uncharacterized RDD family membrane protein YckC|nr:RDD family protein [Methanothrix sp.]
MDEQPPSQLVSEVIYASIFKRWVALIIDSFLIGLAVGLITVLLGRVGDALIILVYFIVFIGYFTYLEWTKGQTLGKSIVGIKVIKENGSPCDLTAAFIRTIFRYIDGLVLYLVVFFTAKKQRIGDMVAKTVVVKVN